MFSLYRTEPSKAKKEKGKSEKGTPFFAGFANKQTALFLDAGN